MTQPAYCMQEEAVESAILHRDNTPLTIYTQFHNTHFIQYTHILGLTQDFSAIYAFLGILSTENQQISTEICG